VNQSRIEGFFERYARGLLKWRWMLIVLIASVFALSSFGLKKLEIVYSNHELFLASDSIVIKTEEFEELFGQDLFVGILVSNDSLFSKSELQKVKNLTQKLEETVPYVKMVNAITNIHFPESRDGQWHLNQLIPDAIPSSVDSLSVLKNSFLQKHIVFNRILSTDGNSSLISLTFDIPLSKDNREEVQASIDIGSKIYEVISDPQFSSLHPKATGIPYINYMEKDYFNKESTKIILFALIIAIFILMFITRSFLGMVSPFLITVLSLVIVFGMGGWFGLSVAGLVISLPILLSLAVSIAYSIHILTFHKKYLRDGLNNDESIIKAIANIGWPMLFTSLTTFFALLTILFIKVPAIREIGVISAFCVLTVFLITFNLLPIFLSFKKQVPRTQRRVMAASLRSKIEDRYLQLVLKYHRTIIVSTLLLVIAGIIGITKVRATFDLKESVGENVPYIDEILQVANSELGSLYTYDIELSFSRDASLTSPENLDKLEILTEEIKNVELTKNVTSVLNLIKGFNYILHNFDSQAYSIPKTKTEIDVIVFMIRNFGLNEIGKWINQKRQIARIKTELGQYDSKSLQESNEVIRKKAEGLFKDVEVNMLGTVPQFARVNEYVVQGQIQSFATAILLILLLIILVFRSIKVGLVALIPNIVPVIFIGGIMGYFNIPLDMMTVTIIPIMIGLGVDDTIHLFSHFEKEFGISQNYHRSIKISINKVGPALIYTTVILSANFLIYVTSNAKIFVHTGLLTTIGLVSALLADLLLAPILFRYFSVFGKEV
jgi:predicted RND superfamily exporter protein